MLKLSRVMVAASSAALVFLPAGVALAQGTPSGAAPAATSTIAPEAGATENTASERAKAAPKKRKPARMTRQQEIDRSIDSGTVPARYRNSVPKEYQQYIPFDKR
jgi:hypothetical protein